MIHTMIRVMDLAKSHKFYAEVFDMHETHGLDFPEFALSYLRSPESGIELELTWNKGREEDYSHGTGYGHVAFVVDDVAGEHARILALGYEPLAIKEFKRGDELLARFFFIQDPDGYKIEILQKHGHYQ